MHKKIITVVGITILFLGLAIQPSIATVQPEKIDVEPDVEGLVAQLRVAVNDILQRYGNNPMVRSLCNIILDLTWYPGKIIICLFLLICFILTFGLFIKLLINFDIKIPQLEALAMFVFGLYLILFDCYPGWPYKSLKPISTLTGKININNLVNDCPCQQL